MLFTVGFGGGGAEKVFVSLANHWVEQGHEVKFVVINDAGPMKVRLNPRCEVLKLQGNAPVLRQYLFPRALAKLVSHESPDVLFSTLTYANCIAGKARGLMKADAPKVVLREANSLANLRKRGRLRFLLDRFRMRSSYGQADALLVNAAGLLSEMKELLGDRRPKKVVCIPNPVETPNLPTRASAPEVSGTRLVACGRLIPQKGFVDLLKAFALLPNRGEWTLKILGEGPDLESLQELTMTLGVSEQVEFPGFVENVFSFYANADIFVLSSHWEGFPNALVEAMAAGLKVVATDCPGACRDILGDRLSDCLVPVGDPKTLASTIEKVRNAQDLGRIGMELVKARYSFAATAERYLDLAGLVGNETA